MGRFLLCQAALVALLWAMPTALPWGVGDGAAVAEVRNPAGVAVIVGNRAYTHRDVPEVTFAHRDADAFRRYVVDVLGYDPENIVDLRDATRGELFDAFGTLADPQGLLWSYLDPDGGSQVVVFYSGHGVPGVNDGRGYLLPVDADPKAAENDGYPIDLLYENLGGLPEAGSVRVYLDACFSGGSHEGVLIRDASPVYLTPALPEGVGEKVVSLTAASGKQVASWDRKAEHGLFTHHLLDALYGGGDADGDGRVTAQEAKAYLDRHMTRAARRQHRRVQEASLSGAEGVVLAAAPADGEFPARPDSDGHDAEPARTVSDVGGEDTPAPLDEAAVIGGRAILVVKTAPPGTAVLVGGVGVGETPLERYDLRAGIFTLTLDHPTHETVLLEDETLADNKVLRIERTLAPATGSVTVITRPSGGWVEQDGQRLAETTPVTLEGLPSGPAVLRVGAAGHRPVAVEVAVPKGGVALVEQVLEEARYGTLTLALEPADAKVTLTDGGEPYRAGMTLTAGEHRVRVTREGYRAVSRTVAVAGETHLRIALEPEPQPFTVVVTPPEAEVRLLDTAETYRGRDGLAAGHVPCAGERRGLGGAGGGGSARDGTDPAYGGSEAPAGPCGGRGSARAGAVGEETRSAGSCGGGVLAWQGRRPVRRRHAECAAGVADRAAPRGDKSSDGRPGQGVDRGGARGEAQATWGGVQGLRGVSQDGGGARGRVHHGFAFIGTGPGGGRRPAAWSDDPVGVCGGHVRGNVRRMGCVRVDGWMRRLPAR